MHMICSISDLHLNVHLFRYKVNTVTRQYQHSQRSKAHDCQEMLKTTGFHSQEVA